MCLNVPTGYACGRMVERGLARCHADIQRAVSVSPAQRDREIDTDTGPATTRLAELTEQVTQSERQLAEIDKQLTELRRDLVTEADVQAAFADFENVWSALTPREQVQVLHLLVHRVEYDATDTSIEVAFYPAGIKALAGGANGESAQEQSDVSAAANPSEKPSARGQTKRLRRTKEAAA